MEWDKEKNILTEEDKEQESERLYRENEERIRIERVLRIEDRVQRRVALGFFIPEFLSEDDMIENFEGIAEEQRSSGSPPYVNDNGITRSWSTNKIWIVCQSCGCITYKLTDDISELQKCPSYSCKSRNIRIIRSGEIALAVRETNRGLNMTEVYNARRERLRAIRAERSAARRNA